MLYGILLLLLLLLSSLESYIYALRSYWHICLYNFIVFVLLCNRETGCTICSTLCRV